MDFFPSTKLTSLNFKEASLKLNYENKCTLARQHMEEACARYETRYLQQVEAIQRRLFQRKLSQLQKQYTLPYCILDGNLVKTAWQNGLSLDLDLATKRVHLSLHSVLYHLSLTELGRYLDAPDVLLFCKSVCS